MVATNTRLSTKFKPPFFHKGLLPKGHYYSLTWGIAYEFGGMTTVALDRSSAFARQDNRQVEILTLSPEMKAQDRENELHAEERIDRRVKIRNLWKDLTSWPERSLQRMVGTLDIADDAAADMLRRSGTEWSEFRKADDGTVLQIDRYHDRGHLLVTDRFDMHTRGKRKGRRITLFDRSQNIIGQWATARAFYHAWLDVVFDGKPTYLISDSSFTGALVHDYRRDNVILCQVMHNHYLQHPKGDKLGELSPGKFEFLSHLDSFDLVTTLTDRQRLDMADANLSTDRLRTVSNLTDDLQGDPTTTRDRRSGAMIARLTGQKRVDDAVNAVSKAITLGSNAQLDIYGEGPKRPILERLIRDLDVTEAVRLHGHTSGAKHKFRTASFSLLTSRFEGQGLVILESMSAGCIPIAYDCDYGPAEIITNGVDGFLIPEGDIDSCATAILRMADMSDAELEEMRRAAIARAADFFEYPIVARWGEVLAEKTFEPIPRLNDLQAHLASAVVTDDSINLTVHMNGAGGMSEIGSGQAFVSWRAREGSFFGRVPATTNHHELWASIPSLRLVPLPSGLIDISVDLVQGRSFNRSRVSSDNSRISNEAELVALYTTAHGNLSARIGLQA